MSLESRFERALWNTRLLVLAPVLASIAAAIGILVVAAIDSYAYLRSVWLYARGMSGHPEHGALEVSLITLLDDYLLGAVLVLFGMGLYELFISRIEVADGSEVAKKLLLVTDLDDFKNRLTKVVLLILIIKFFEYAMSTKTGGPESLMYLAIAVFLISAAFWISSQRHG